MRLGLNLGYLVGADDARGQLRLTQHAESLGFERGVGGGGVRVGQPDRARLAGRADLDHRRRVGGDADPRRGLPAMTAMTAASLDLLSEGRFSLGLGVSGPQVSEGWHGVRFDRPLARTREYVDILKLALGRKTVAYEGRTYTLPLPDGPGKALKLTIAPHADRIPIYLAAVGPKNLELAGEIADGWLAIFFAPEFAEEQLGHVDSRPRRRRTGSEGFDVVADDPARRRSRPAGVRRSRPPVRRPLPRRHGQPGEELLQPAGGPDGLRRGGRHRPGPLSVPAPARRHGGGAVRVHRLDLLARDRRSGSRSGWRVRWRLGVTTAALAPHGDSLEEKLAALTTAAEALELAGVA